MGLDQYAFVKAYASPEATDPVDVGIAQWRKHPNLHGFFERRWRALSPDNKDFNTEQYQITEQDIKDLLKCLGRKPEDCDLTEQSTATTGFFFGKPCDTDPDEWWKTREFAFVAETYIADGLTVVYDSWW